MELIMPLPTPAAGWPKNVTPPVHFINHQWAVTGYGLECVQPGAGLYEAEGSRMNETRPGTDLYDWPLHMAEKDWVDLGAFNEAFEHALRLYCPRDFNADRLARSIAEGRALRLID
jgi:hypothetical protein